MINIHSNQKSSSEHRIACRVKEALEAFIPNLSESVDDVINIYVEPRLATGKVFSVDLVIAGIFKSPVIIKNNQKFNFINYQKDPKKDGNKTINFSSIALKNFITVVEIKHSDPSHLELKNGELIQTFKYSDKMKNVTKQNIDQMWGFSDHIQASYPHVRITPLVSRFIYCRMLQSDHPFKSDKYILHGHSTGEMILACIASHMLRVRYPENIYEVPQSDVRISQVQAFELKHEDLMARGEYFPSAANKTRLDQNRMLQLVRSSLKQDWVDNLGSKMQIFQGLGGTGKTVRLLQLAHKKYIAEGSNCIFFTYNWSLISNVERLMTIQGIPKYNEDSGGILIESIEGFLGKVLFKLEYLSGNFSDQNWSKNYNQKLTELMADLEGGAVSSREIKEAVFDRGYDYEFVFIDEGQDWSENEQYIIKLIFGPENLTVAHGREQNIRGVETNWAKNINTNDVNSITLRKALRMKPNLAEFVRQFASRTFRNESFKALQDSEDSSGGHITLIIGDYSTNINMIHSIMFNLPEDVEPIDNLHCMISSSRITHELANKDVSIWHGFDEKLRKTPPNNINQSRFVNYKSSRGLEGWTTFLYDFDKFWDLATADGLRQFQNKRDMLDSPDAYAQDHAAKWALIALTRSIDSTVIHINSENSYIGKILMDIHKEMDDCIEIIKL